MAPKFEIKGENLIITMPINKELAVSKSGKTHSIASTNGNKPTDLKVGGKILYVGVNAYVYAAERTAEEKARTAPKKKPTEATEESAE